MKRILLAVIIIIIIFFLISCGSDKKKSENITPVGSYLLFQTDDVSEYLDFLENLDESQYEIIDISTFVRETAFDFNNDYYMITYKKIK